VDFKNVIEKIVCFFEKDNIDYAFIGGVALGLWGVGRSTVDIDILVNKDDIGKVDRIMTGLGYECRFRSENVSQYISPLRVFGEIDFLHAFREASMEMLDHAEEKTAFNNTLKIKVAKPEDLIGLKLQAIKNNPKRNEQDTADIEMLISIQKKQIDWSLIKKYCIILEMDEIYEKLERISE
jgi:hypothetical protein